MLMALLLLCASGQSQPTADIKWWNPAADTHGKIGGRLFADSLMYSRLPANAKPNLRPEVWKLAQNSAGEYIDFSTNASEIIVRYTLAAKTHLPHMPSTGVGGVDLYVKDKQGWHWAKSKYAFGDTVEYRFQHIPTGFENAVFRLYLPLYDAPGWLQIGVRQQFAFSAENPVSKKNVVVYGTSIAQGACASRPGLAWTNILSRTLGKDVINLGFSGNGQLEASVIQLLDSVDASVFVLDCMPNLYDETRFTKEEVIQRIFTSVKNIRRTHPHTPILLVEHACGRPGFTIDTLQQKRYLAINQVLTHAYRQLLKSGSQNLFFLSAEEIGLTAEHTVDGTHPNDAGMIQYAAAYEKILHNILKLRKTHP
jgi:lysophospholipase L1-like esterase